MLDSAVRAKDVAIPYVLDVVTLAGGRFRDEDGDQMTSCVPQLVGSVEALAKQRHQEADTDKAVLAVLMTDSAQSANAIRRRVRKQDKEVRAFLARLKAGGQAEAEKGGWVRAA